MSLNVETNPEIVMTNRQVQDGFRAKGITINKWSEENGFTAALVYAVLQVRISRNVTGDFAKA